MFTVTPEFFEDLCAFSSGLLSFSKGHPEVDRLRTSHLQWLMDTKQEEKAGEVCGRISMFIVLINLSVVFIVIVIVIVIVRTYYCRGLLTDLYITGLRVTRKEVCPKLRHIVGSQLLDNRSRVSCVHFETSGVRDHVWDTVWHFTVKSGNTALHISSKLTTLRFKRGFCLERLNERAASKAKTDVSRNGKVSGDRQSSYIWVSAVQFTTSLIYLIIPVLYFSIITNCLQW